MPRAVQPAAIRVAAACIALLSTTQATAALFTVGPAGTYATLPMAIAAADAAPGDSHEIRLQEGSFTDQPVIVYDGGKTLDISGGWDAAFALAFKGAEATSFSLAPGATGRPLHIEVQDGHILLDRFAAQDGNAVNGSGGLLLGASGTGTLAVSRCEITDNRGSTPNSAVGGGIRAATTDDATLSIFDCAVRRNTITVGGSAVGGGIYATSEGTSHLTIERVLVVANTQDVRADATSTYITLTGAGVYAQAYDASTLDLSGSAIVANTTDGSGAPGNVDSSGYGLDIGSGGTGPGGAIARVRNVAVRGNTVSNTDSGTRAHAFVSTGGIDARMDLGDSEIARGDGGDYGLFVHTYGDTPTSQLHVTNITVAHNDGMGVRGTDRFPIFNLGSFYNSIVTDNGTASTLPGWMTAGANRIDQPTAFVNPAIGNYALVPGSPAIDAGNMTPPGGLGAVDGGGGPRVIGPRVDQGAYEFGVPPLFADGFESP